MHTQLLDNIVNNLLNKYTDGQEFFTALDKSIQHPMLVSTLLSIAPKDKTVIVSGHFGQYVANSNIISNLFVLPGNIRHTPEFSLEHCADFIKHKDFIFLDDSYYSGRTQNIIRREIEKYKGNFIHTFAIYDGGMYKDKMVTSLFRYHERN